MTESTDSLTASASAAGELTTAFTG